MSAEFVILVDGLAWLSEQRDAAWERYLALQDIPESHVPVPHETIETERAGSVADGNSNTPRGAVVESGVQPDAGEVDAEFKSRPGPLSASSPVARCNRCGRPMR